MRQAGEGVQRQIAELSGGVVMICQPRDHRGVVRAEFFRGDQRNHAAGNRRLKTFAQRRIAGDAAAQNRGPAMKMLHGVKRLCTEDIHHGFLIGCKRIGQNLPLQMLRIAVRRKIARMIQQCGFKPAETEVETVFRSQRLACRAGQGAGEILFADVAGSRQFFDDGSARITEIQHLRALVETLSRGIVDRAPDHPRPAVFCDNDN